MKTFNDYLEEFNLIVSQKRPKAGDFIIRRDIWIYFKWTLDMGIDDPMEAHKRISEETDIALQDCLKEAEKLFLKTKNH